MQGDGDDRPRSDSSLPTAVVRSALPAQQPTGIPTQLPPGVVIHPAYALYSSRQVRIATLFGGPLGGAALIALNYRRLGETSKAWLSLILGLVATAALVGLGLAMPNGLGGAIPIGSIFAMGFIAEAVQGVAYSLHLAAQGRRASWWAAIGLGVASLALVGGVVLAGVATVGAMTMPAVTVGESSVIYSNGAAEAEARAVGNELTRLGYLQADQTSLMKVTRDHGRPVVVLVVEQIAFRDGEVQSALHGLAEPLSKAAFSGQPVDIWLADDDLEPKIKLTWEHRPPADRQ